jgi:sodium-coupled monocarboxylate transporter 8/12
MFQVFRNFDDKKGLMVNKIIVLLSGVIILILTYVVAASGDNLVQLSGSLNGTFNGPITGLFVLSLFFSCANKHGAIYGFAIGWASNAWLAVGALITSPVYPKLDVSVESCRNDTFVLSQNLTSSLISFNGESNLSGFNTFYAMGYNWYTSFGALVTILFGVVISIATGGLRNQVDKSFIIYDLSKWFKLKPIHRSSYDEKF